jgi:hypothetical protein
MKGRNEAQFFSSNATKPARSGSSLMLAWLASVEGGEKRMNMAQGSDPEPGRCAPEGSFHVEPSDGLSTLI